jgi:GT2 family glycosyltransferase
MPTHPMPPPKKITVVIPNWNGMSWLGACLESLKRQDLPEFHTIVVDNGSTDESVTFIKENYPRIEIVELAGNTGFANAANIGIERSASPYVALLNADTQVYPDWLSNLLERIDNSPAEIVAINSQLLRMDQPERIDDAGDELSWYGAATKRGHNQAAADFQEEKEIFSPCAAACLYRRDFLLATGGFDADLFAYLEDLDLGLRGRLLGYRYLYLPKAKVLHKGHGASLPHSRYVEMITRNRLLLFAKNIPGRLLLRHAAKLLYGQIYFMAAYARPWSSIKGYLSFLVGIPSIMSKRRQMLKEISLNLDQIDLLLHRRVPSPSIGGLLSAYLSKVVGKTKNLLFDNSAR